MPYKQPEYRFHHTLQAKDILKDLNSTIEYQQGMSFFYGELAHLGASAHTIERIIDFPWDVFGGFLGPPYFFRLVVGNFLEYGAIMAARIYRDKRKDTYDLVKFRDRILSKLIKEEHRETLRCTLTEVDFDQQAAEGFEKAKKLRDNMLVHSNKVWFDFSKVPVDPPEQGEEALEAISFGASELRSLRDALDAVYMAL